MDRLMVLRRQVEEYDYLEEEKFRLVAEYWLEQINIENLTAREFFDSYVEAVYLRVVKREWFKQGRLLKYRFVFKSIGKRGKGKKKQADGGDVESENHLFKTTLNTRVCSSKGKVASACGRFSQKWMTWSRFIGQRSTLERPQIKTESSSPGRLGCRHRQDSGTSDRLGRSR